MTPKYLRGGVPLARRTAVVIALALAIASGSPWTVRRLGAQIVSTIGTKGFVTPFSGDGNAVVLDNFVFRSEPVRLLVAGSTGDALHRQIQVVSYRLADAFGNPDGLDTGWGANHDGRAILQLNGDNVANAITLDGLGRAVVVGSHNDGNSDSFLIARFTRAGILDTTFGGGRGFVKVDLGGHQDIATAVRVDLDTRIVVAGLTFQSSIFNPFNLGGWDIGVVRLLDNGDRDQSFDDDGIQITGLTDFEEPKAVLLDHFDDPSNDRIWVIGSKFAEDDDFSQIFILRLNGDGSIDHSFGDVDQFLGHTGREQTGFGQRWSDASDALFDQQGRLVIAGSASPRHPAFVDGDFNNANLAIARFNIDGTIDTSFGNNGVTITDVTGRDDFARAVRLDSTLKLFVAGFATTLVNHTDFVLARYDQNGHLDTQFGVGGFLTSGFTLDGQPTANNFGLGLAFTDVPGEIVLVGNVQSAVSGNFFAGMRLYGEQPGVFSLAAAPTLSSVAGSTTSTVTVTSANGFEGAMTLTLAGDKTGGPLPPGFTATMGDSQTLSTQLQLTPDQASNVVVHVDVAPFVLPGSYTLWLIGTPDPLGNNKIPLVVTVRADTASLFAVVLALDAAGAIDSPGIANALESKLTAAQIAQQQGNAQAATNTLAAFVNQVEAQRGKHIASTATIGGTTFDPSAVLLADARDAIAGLKAAAANTIVGYVTDSSGREVRDATVAIVDASNTIVANVSTDATGLYYVASTSVLTPSARYSVRVNPLPGGFTTVGPSAQFFTWASAPVILGTFVVQ
jgi:uncharacterized delta-60 repeat protein